MNSPIIYWVVSALLILFFFYTVYQSARTWRAMQLVTVIFVFLTAMWFVVCASLTVKTHNKWRTEVRKQTEQLTAATKSRDEMLYGDTMSVSDLGKPSLRSVSAKLGRSLTERGRVWRGCTLSPQRNPDGTLTLNTTPPGAPAAPNAANHIEQNTILYAFVEGDPNPEDVRANPEERAKVPSGTRLPRAYVGEFTVTAVTNTSVALKETMPISNLAQLMTVGPTWALYETMPLDGHRLFSVDPVKQPTIASTNADENPVFGKMDKQVLQRLMPPTGLYQQAPEQHARLIDSYERDGRRARQDDSPDNVWQKVEFIKEHTAEVDTSGDPIGAVQPSPLFDKSGRATIALLRAGKPVTLKVRDVAVLPQEAAKQLIGLGVCSRVEDIYVRPLNDYEAAFRDLYEQWVKLQESVRQIQRDTAEVTRTNELVLAQIKHSEDERTKLNEDLKHVNEEREKVTQLAAAMEAKYADVKQELRRLYLVNNQLAAELARLDVELTTQINRRSAAAASGTP